VKRAVALSSLSGCALQDDQRSLKFTEICAAARTGLPSFVPGLKRHCMTAFSRWRAYL
jgi:hypothetical protein